MPVFQGVRKTQNTLLKFFFLKPPIKIAFLGEGKGKGKMRLKMGCICCMMKTGSLLKLMPTYPSELERTQSCLFTWAKLDFPPQPPSLMAPCSHPSQYFSRLWNYIFVVDWLQLQILSSSIRKRWDRLSLHWIWAGFLTVRPTGCGNPYDVRVSSLWP